MYTTNRDTPGGLRPEPGCDLACLGLTAPLQPVPGHLEAAFIAVMRVIGVPVPPTSLALVSYDPRAGGGRGLARFSLHPSLLQAVCEAAPKLRFHKPEVSVGHWQGSAQRRWSRALRTNPPPAPGRATSALSWRSGGAAAGNAAAVTLRPVAPAYRPSSREYPCAGSRIAAARALVPQPPVCLPERATQPAASWSPHRAGDRTPLTCSAVHATPAAARPAHHAPPAAAITAAPVAAELPAHPIAALAVATSTTNNSAEPCPAVPPSPQPTGPHEELEFTVEAFLERRTVGRRIEYLVKWQGFNPCEDATACTWEPARHLMQDLDRRTYRRLVGQWEAAQAASGAPASSGTSRHGGGEQVVQPGVGGLPPAASADQ